MVRAECAVQAGDPRQHKARKFQEAAADPLCLGEQDDAGYPWSAAQLKGVLRHKVEETSSHRAFGDDDKEESNIKKK